MIFQKLSALFFISFFFIGILSPVFYSLAKDTAQDCAAYCKNPENLLPPFGVICFCSKDNPQCPPDDPNCEHSTREEGIIKRALNWIFYFTLIGTPFVVLVASIIFFTSAGAQKRAATARKTIIYAVIGFTLALTARLFYTLIRFLTGI